jgi:hypothetical protein
MAAVRLDLFNDIARRKLVNSETDASELVLPDFFHQDKISIEIIFLKTNIAGGRFKPYERVNTSGMSFQIKLFKVDVNNNATVLASQTVWSSGTTENSLAAALDLNTANMAAELPAPPSQLSTVAAILEFELSDAAGKFTTYQRAVTIKREHNTSGSPVAIPGVTYFTSDEALALFVRKIEQAGATITLKSPNGTYARVIGVNNDGSAQDDVI